MRIRILGPQWEKMVQIWIFKFVVLFFPLIFMRQLDELFRNQEIFTISFFNSWVLRVNFFCCSIWLIFYPLDPDPWIRKFLRIRIQEAKLLLIQRIQIRILSTVKFNSHTRKHRCEWHFKVLFFFLWEIVF